MERKQQSGFGNNVPYILTVIPHIDSRRTQIIWNVPAALGVKPRHKEFVNLTKGETYTFKANIKPMKSGTYDFSVSAIAWEHDTNYTNAISDRVQFDSKLVLQPITTHYRRTNTLKFALLFTFFLVSCFVVIRIFMKISPKMKDWLTPPHM